jgi:protease II
MKEWGGIRTEESFQLMLSFSPYKKVLQPSMGTQKLII